jgi:hypothetical protein
MTVKMYKFLILILLFFISSFVSSQNLIDLYMDYLPDYIKYNEQTKNMVGGQMIAKTNVHPDLIYFHIERIHLQLLEPNQNIRTRRLSFFEEIEKKYIRRRADWATEQINHLKKSQYHQDIKSDCFSRFEKFIIETKERPNSFSGYDLTIDLSKQAYFKFIYYSKKTVPYDSSVNYDIECEAFEQEKYQSYRLLYEKLKNNKEPLTDETISEISKLWFIFEQNKDGIEAYELYAQNFALNEKRIPFYRYGIGLGYAFNNTFDINHEINIPDLSNPAKILETSKTNQVFIAIQRYIPLNEAWMQFTYLNIELTAAFSASNYRSSFYADSKNDVWIADTLHQEILRFNTSEILIRRRNTYQIKMSTPVYSIARRFFIDLGLGAGINSIDYEINYQYDYLKRRAYYIETNVARELHEISSIIDSSNYISEIKTDNYLFFLVSLDLRYLLSNGILLNFALNQRFWAIKLGYNF